MVDCERRDYCRCGPDRSYAGRRIVPCRRATDGAGARAAAARHIAGRRYRRPNHAAAALPGPAGAIRSGEWPTGLLVGEMPVRRSMYLDFSRLTDRPLRGLQLRQEQLERLLDERARELGADIRRGAEIVGVDQDDDTATADVRGPDGPYHVSARYLGRLRRRRQQGSHRGRDSVPRQHLSGGQPSGAAHPARLGDALGQRRPRGSGAGKNPCGPHADRARRLRTRVDHPGRYGCANHRRRKRRRRR